MAEAAGGQMLPMTGVTLSSGCHTTTRRMTLSDLIGKIDVQPRAG